MSRSDVYLVSSKPFNPNTKDGTFDNPGFTAPEEKVTYSPENGVDVPISAYKSRPLRPYRGMGKEDLLHFSSQPFWSRLRMICIAFIFLAWLALIIAVVALVLTYPKCRDPAARTWWQSEGVYRVYVPSFKDSNNDGIGDIKGIESKLDYIKGLGFGIVSLSPFYKTVDTESTPPFTNFGAGNDMAIIDHIDVGGVYGTIADFDSLVSAANERDMFVVVDFIPNLTSDQHPWFVESKSNTSNEYRNYYIWQGAVPNNWISVYGGSTWAQPGVGARSDYYLHQFRVGTPDLNLRSAQVQNELEGILEFWLDHGVSGFNIRDASYLFEDYDMRDEPTIPGETGYNGLDHIYTTNQPEVYSMLSRWRTFVRSYNKTTIDKLLMTDTNGNLDITTAYGVCDQAGIQMPLNTRLTNVNSPCDAVCVAEYVDGWMNVMPSGRWPNWVIGDENTPRLARRFSAGFINPYTIMMMLLPGTPVFYYGDEIGINPNMTDTSDVWSRDRSMRSIMTWIGNSTDAGFCNTTCSQALWTNGTGEPSDGTAETGTQYSELIKELIQLRREPSFHVGDYFMAVRDSTVISFVREFDGETGYLVAVNFGPNEVSRDFTGSHDTIQKDAVVSFVHGGSYAKDDDADTSDLKIPPHGGVVVSWDYVAEEL